MKTLFYFLLMLFAANCTFAISVNHDLKIVKQTNANVVIDNPKECGSDPFSTEKSLSFYVNEPVFVYIDIVKPGGELVKRIIAKELKSGRHTFKWDGKDALNNIVKSGVYQFNIKTEKCEYKKTLAFLQ